jgi:hypothetical protein
MAITLKRQLNDEEKKRILQRHGRICFATGHPIPDGDPLHFDHIKAFVSGGPSDLDNIAPMCEEHNKGKGTLPLEDYRIKLRLEDFFSTGDRLTLRHLLEYLKEKGDIPEFGRGVTFRENNGEVHVQTAQGDLHYDLYECPTTHWKYFFATLPVRLLDSDDEDDKSVGLQPRYLIFDKVFNLYRHFQGHPVLQPSIGRVVGSRIRLFDGQHKIAALLWTNRRDFECKIYLSHDIRLLNETNISAHDKFAQTRFYSSIMVAKLGSQFGVDFERYKNREDGEAKSERGFMKYLSTESDHSLRRGDLNERFRNYLYNSVLENGENRLGKFVSASNRGSDSTPLTMDMLHKSLFSCFLYREPIEHNLATADYKRDQEIDNMVALMNMIHDLGMHAWNPEAGENDAHQRKLNRVFRSKSMMAWSELLRDAVCGKLELQDGEERQMPLYRSIGSQEMDRVKRVVERLFSWTLWSSPENSEIDRILSDNKSVVKDWLKSHGLTTGYLMGAAE